MRTEFFTSLRGAIATRQSADETSGFDAGNNFMAKQIATLPAVVRNDILSNQIIR
ncbi:MAG TPA: hypothetical protein PKZ64_05425 [Spirochaetota bacterium]|nr:hypothetical protein [Spirochaetota bacterium]HPR36869.1 hypothetical protein [Spirochaetota bacterium]